MKQHITREQWNELTDKQAEVLTKWQGERNYWNEEIDEHFRKIDEDLGNPNIGQMIEFLGDDWYKDFYRDTPNDETHPIFKGELADILWKAVKAKLK